MGGGGGVLYVTDAMSGLTKGRGGLVIPNHKIINVSKILKLYIEMYHTSNSQNQHLLSISKHHTPLFKSLSGTQTYKTD